MSCRILANVRITAARSAGVAESKRQQIRGPGGHRQARVGRHHLHGDRITAQVVVGLPRHRLVHRVGGGASAVFRVCNLLAGGGHSVGPRCSQQRPGRNCDGNHRNSQGDWHNPARLRVHLHQLMRGVRLLLFGLFFVIFCLHAFHRCPAAIGWQVRSRSGGCVSTRLLVHNPVDLPQ